VLHSRFALVTRSSDIDRAQTKIASYEWSVVASDCRQAAFLLPQCRFSVDAAKVPSAVHS
jgi:hypothetical protein